MYILYCALLEMLGKWATELKLHTYGVCGFNTQVYKQPSVIQSQALSKCTFKTRMEICNDLLQWIQLVM